VGSLPEITDQDDEVVSGREVEGLPNRLRIMPIE
jgi:hypothetical protein